ncbi:MAG: hypothetical protein QOC90_2741, partial [Mycobacterium sp.]|nr:hypothetical protein [Mycobacterium sp.]
MACGSAGSSPSVERTGGPSVVLAGRCSPSHDSICPSPLVSGLLAVETCAEIGSLTLGIGVVDASDGVLAGGAAASG